MSSALVVGSGPNGRAAATTLGQAGVSVTVVEAAESIGGGLRSDELTLPGLLHDHCAAIVPTAVASPFMQSLDLEAHGVQWAWPHIELVHPLDIAGRPNSPKRTGCRGNLSRALLDAANPSTIERGGADVLRDRARHGWPAVIGGTARLADALASIVRSLGGRIEKRYSIR
jgi:phytoene dehydrogenase-like protein